MMGALGSVFDFFHGVDPNSPAVTSYVGFEVFLNNVNFDRTRTFRFDCNNQCDYFQRITYGLKMKEIGFRLNVGFMLEVVGPMSLEVAWAAGIMNRSFSEDNRKPIDYERFFGLFYDEDNTGVIASFNMNIKLVFDLK